jgi:hypothetical protein
MDIYHTLPKSVKEKIRFKNGKFDPKVYLHAIMRLRNGKVVEIVGSDRTLFVLHDSEIIQDFGCDRKSWYEWCKLENVELHKLTFLHLFER